MCIMTVPTHDLHFNVSAAFDELFQEEVSIPKSILRLVSGVLKCIRNILKQEKSKRHLNSKIWY